MTFSTTPRFTFFVLIAATLFRSAHFKVSMWINENEVQAFAGVPMEIKIIQNDKLEDYVRRGPKFTSGLPPIPPLADSINVTWTSGKRGGPYNYKFLRIRAEDPSIMEGLKLSIPRSGVIPRHPTDFRVSLPCTGLKAGIAYFKLVFEVRDQNDKPLEGSPIRLKLGKFCRLQNDTCLAQKCANGGVCTPFGDCLCEKGFVGKRCEHSAKCRNDCNRRGVCLRDDVCNCRPGFRGKYCQKRAKRRDGKKTTTATKDGRKKKGGRKGKRGGKKSQRPTTQTPYVTNEVELHPTTKLSSDSVKHADINAMKKLEAEEKRRKRKNRRRERKNKHNSNVTAPSKMR